MIQLLTHSRQDCFKTCRKKHWFAYLQGIRSETDAKALRMGSAFHDGIEQLGKGLSIEEAVAVIRERYQNCPDKIDERDWRYEEETVVRLVCGYQWHWQNDKLTYIATEESFTIPLVNPQTGKPSRNWQRAGKIDGIVQLEDSRLAVKESKLLGDDISPDSDLWRRMRLDHQVSGYVDAARKLTDESGNKYNVDTVLYDVCRKPTIKPTAVPCCDEFGLKIVRDCNGDRVFNKDKTPRQTSDTAKGFYIVTRDMTVEEWGEKLNNDIAEQPGRYYQRVEIARLDQNLDEYRAEMWDVQKTMSEAINSDRHYRTVNKNTCDFCSYFGLCTSGWKPGDMLPPGLEKVSNIHPELSLGESNVNGSTRQDTACAAAT